MKTWMYEAFIAAGFLGIVNLITNATWVSWLGSLAVFISFMHGQVSDRMAEKQEAMTVPDVECYLWERRYFLLKEILWVGYFINLQAWPALAGCAFFILYRWWRSYYRTHKDNTHG
jgi:hypothetical protein